MARLARLCIPGHPHLVQQRGHNGQPVFLDEADTQGFLRLLADGAKASGVAVHAYGLAADEVHLLATPAAADSLSRLMQALGRQHGQAFNRRHARSGSLWDGRFRAVPIDGKQHLLAAMRYVESAAPDLLASSAAHHLGQAVDHAVSDHPLYWALGNTPFDREMKYRAWFEQGTSSAEADRFRRAVTQGWPLGERAFIDDLSQLTSRRLAARPRGRPPKAPL
ncbi:transposase [Rhizobacter sp. SG703]|uniref:transposase n=1 Tax=Rhizobacter sp. SG703 TaxID=2587140 RepID=UPI001444A6BC|nr:transposase [Rhizobacter sp. SG703]NKI93809.1 putative transposase [Rhizobacter sp. SG703]